MCPWYFEQYVAAYFFFFKAWDTQMEAWKCPIIPE